MFPIISGVKGGGENNASTPCFFDHRPKDEKWFHQVFCFKNSSTVIPFSTVLDPLMGSYISSDSTSHVLLPSHVSELCSLFFNSFLGVFAIYLDYLMSR